MMMVGTSDLLQHGVLVAVSLLVGSGGVVTALGAGGCRCVPHQPCWPSRAQWAALNETVLGQLIRDEPVARPCYPGPHYDPLECRVIDDNWANTTFQQQSPVGYMYPLFVDCPPVNATAGETATGSCSLGAAPVYTVNATCVEDVAAGLAFAEKWNLRLVVRDTGHDLLGRSAGYGSLQIWIKYLRTGIEFHEKFEQNGSTWRGSAFTIGGGYTWSDVYPLAEARGKIVVGGGTPSVGCLGGWMQGGGHSPATHAYGLGADNVLAARVVLANGSLVTASPHSHQDLFFAIRGGGPGTYGIVVETTVKAWPTTSVVAQTLAFAPLTDSESDVEIFMQTLTDLYTSFPALADAGWSGFGSWSVDGAVAVFSNFTIGYAHTVANFRLPLSASKKSFAPLLQTLQDRNGSALYVYLAYNSVPTYADYYNAFSGTEPPSGTLSQLGSRFLDADHLTSNRSALLSTLRTVAGKKGEHTTNVVELLGGRTSRIAKDGTPSTAAGPVSGVNPAWRDMVMQHITSRTWTQDTPADAVAAINHDITYVKTTALKALAPETGCYMNEADRLDPEYIRDFYGRKEHYRCLEEVKGKYDPKNLFYCPTCVGSEKWDVKRDGKLCRI